MSPATQTATENNTNPVPNPKEVAAYLASLGHKSIIGSFAEQLKSYQQFIGIPETGELDEATLAALRTPRCGNPDPVSNLEFSENRGKWRISNLKFFLEPIPSNVTKARIVKLGDVTFTDFPIAQADFRQVIQSAFNQWSALTGLTFTETATQSEANIVLGFGPIKDKDGKIDGLGNFLAHAVQPPSDGRTINLIGNTTRTVEFDTAEPWMTAAVRNTITALAGQDRSELIDSVALHEIGHALGLGHSRVNEAVMFPFNNPAKRVPAADDVLGMNAIYFLKSQVPLEVESNAVKWAFDAIGNDLVAIKKTGTGTRTTEVHILTAASNYQQFSLQTGTALLETDDNWDFAVASNRDLFGFLRKGTGSHMTEIHVLSAASNYGAFALQTATALHETDASWNFLVAPNRDVLAVLRSGNSGRTEVHVLPAANYGTFSLQTPTALHPTDARFTFRGSANRDVVAFLRNQTGSGTTEVHVLDAATNYSTFKLQTRTRLEETNNDWTFVQTADGDMLAIQKAGTASGKVEVHRISINNG